MMKARLVLEDGTLFEGISRGVEGKVWGEVVFNTSMTGYQEILTDPSYCGQILAMTFPMVGNYGINEEDFESKIPFIRGFIAREICSSPSNWRSVMTLEKYLRDQNVLAADGIDTRALTRHLRKKGTMRGILTTGEAPYEKLVEEAETLPTVSELDLIEEVTGRDVFTLRDEGGKRGTHVIILDLGLKRSIGRSISNTGCRVTVMPATSTAEEIMGLEPNGMVISNGPGDPASCREVIKNVGDLVGRIPILGICLGHQIIALARGAKTFRLKYGHRGPNQPVKDLTKGKVYITSQNHGFAVSEAYLPPGLEVTQRNLNDNTVEGLHDRTRKIISVQYHPESFPGPADSAYIFDQFVKYVREGL